MRHLIWIACFSVGCAGQAPGGSSGDDDMAPDAGTIGRTCPLPMTNADAGAQTALKAQICNVAGSQGASHWYRLSAALPGSPTDIVQIELWDNLGAFAGGTVHTGTFTISGNDADRTKCGVCVRSIGLKGMTGSKEYFATGGTVKVDAVGAANTPFSATVSNLQLVEIDATSLKPISGGCTAALTGIKIDGTVTQVGGTGGGGGGGGGGGAGGGACPTGVGD